MTLDSHITKDGQPLSAALANDSVTRIRELIATTRGWKRPSKSPDTLWKPERAESSQTEEGAVLQETEGTGRRRAKRPANGEGAAKLAAVIRKHPEGIAYEALQKEAGTSYSRSQLSSHLRRMEFPRRRTSWGGPYMVWPTDALMDKWLRVNSKAPRAATAALRLVRGRGQPDDADLIKTLTAAHDEASRRAAQYTAMAAQIAAFIKPRRRGR